jgi:Holliday junction resolvasome RuvABC endonuclease subunit
VGPPGERPIFGAEQFDDGDPDGKIFSDCAAWLERLCMQHSVTHFAVEAAYVPKPVNMRTINRLVGMRAVAVMVAWERRARYREYAASQIATYFTGFARFVGGREAKKATTIWMAKTQGYDVGSDHDKADGLAVWSTGEADMFPHAAMRRGIGPLFLGPVRPA